MSSKEYLIKEMKRYYQENIVNPNNNDSATVFVSDKIKPGAITFLNNQGIFSLSKKNRFIEHLGKRLDDFINSGGVDRIINVEEVVDSLTVSKLMKSLIDTVLEELSSTEWL
jgi:hypothetical protein